MPLQRTWETVRIDLTTPGEWIEVKTKLGKDDERRRTALLLRGQPIVDGKVQGTDAGALLAEAPFATLIVVAKNWNVIDPETGRKAQLTEANLRALSDDDLELLNSRFEELYAEPSEADLKNSLAGGAP